MGETPVKMAVKKIVPVLLIAASALIFPYLVNRCWPFTVDDSFVTLRYSLNLASGYGPVFNPGMQPAEGYTSFLWMLLLAIPHRLGLDAVLFGKVLGIVATLGYMGLACRFATKFGGALGGQNRLLSSAMVIFFLAAFSPTAIHAVSGMETALYTLLLFSFLYLLTVFISAPSKGGAFSLALLCLLVGLTRPEGNLAILTGLCWAFWKVPKPYRRLLAQAVLFGFVLPGGFYFLWRVHYYGTLLPLPFYVKVLHQEAFGPSPIPGAGASFIGVSLRVLVATAMVLLYLRTVIVPAVVSASALFVFFGFPQHVMGYAWRFDFPVIAFLIALAGIAIARLEVWIESEKSFSSKWGRIAGTLFFWLICLLPLGILNVTRGAVGWAQGYAEGSRRAHAALGRRLRSLNSADPARVIAICDAGAVSYYSGWRTVDLCGLNNISVALSGQHDPELVLSQNPDLVVLVSEKTESFEAFFPWEQALYARCLEKGMKRVKTLTFDPNKYYLWVMAIPGTESARSLQDWK